jgi:hypothetical protein
MKRTQILSAAVHRIVIILLHSRNCTRNTFIEYILLLNSSGGDALAMVYAAAGVQSTTAEPQSHNLLAELHSIQPIHRAAHLLLSVPRPTVAARMLSTVKTACAEADCRRHCAADRLPHAPQTAGTGSTCLDCWPCALGCAAVRACYRVVQTVGDAVPQTAVRARRRCRLSAARRRRHAPQNAGAGPPAAGA